MFIMIQLTKLNGKSFLLNPLLFEKIEAFPDTTITLTNGHIYVVKDTIEVVQSLIHQFYQHIRIFEGTNPEVSTE